MSGGFLQTRAAPCTSPALPLLDRDFPAGTTAPEGEA